MSTVHVNRRSKLLRITLFGNYTNICQLITTELYSLQYEVTLWHDALGAFWYICACNRDELGIPGWIFNKFCFSVVEPCPRNTIALFESDTATKSVAQVRTVLSCDQACTQSTRSTWASCSNDCCRQRLAITLVLSVSTSQQFHTVLKWDWLSMVLRLRQHNIGYTADGFYRSDDPTNSVKVLKEGG